MPSNSFGGFFLQYHFPLKVLLLTFFIGSILLVIILVGLGFFVTRYFIADILHQFQVHIFYLVKICIECNNSCNNFYFFVVLDCHVLEPCKISQLLNVSDIIFCDSCPNRIHTNISWLICNLKINYLEQPCNP